MSSILKIGASVLKLSANYILESYSSQKKISKNDVNKIGEAAPVDIKHEEEQLSPEEHSKHQQVCPFLVLNTVSQAAIFRC